MALSFPYPVLGTVRRPLGQGCKICVHSTYCPAVYWGRRYGTMEPLEDSWTGPTDAHGIQCASWSSNPADMVTTVSQADLDENQYIYEQGIGSEADRNGLTAPVTASNLLP